MTERIDFKSMTPEELTAWCKDQGQPAFRGKQLFQWLSRGWPGSRSQSWTAP